MRSSTAAMANRAGYRWWSTKRMKHRGGPGGSITVLTDITLTKMHEVLQKRVLESMVSETSLPS